MIIHSLHTGAAPVNSGQVQDRSGRAQYSFGLALWSFRTHPGRWRVWRMRHSPEDQALTLRTRQAAADFNLPAELIASVLADERVRLDLFDFVQDRLMRAALGLPAPASEFCLRLLERGCRRSVESFSLGLAQMKSGTLTHLERRGYLEGSQSRNDRLRTLLNPVQAPGLVAACLRATADHWARHGVNLEGRPEILATLYSLGLTGSGGVHARPEASTRGQEIVRHAAWLKRRAQAQGPLTAALAGTL